ncbi:hypothetical protein SAMN04487818_10994 [Actinokineospora terrae]|uniref:Uncharacterized protein n=1 Tax=Actinokineospora terrae TaxID=155974 RepID=A0A1H9VUF7_9PSEU|nr:hypothetical protein SAMN04487818_10994 [Actinokineospora terrae]
MGARFSFWGATPQTPTVRLVTDPARLGSHQLLLVGVLCYLAR